MILRYFQLSIMDEPLPVYVMMLKRKVIWLPAFDEKEFNQSYDEESRKVKAQEDTTILFAMIGHVNSGKSSTINQLIGDEVAHVGAKPGETTGIDFYQYTDAITFVDTPGLDDIISKNSKATMKFYKDADIILFFLNAAGTVFSEGEKRTFELIRK